MTRDHVVETTPVGEPALHIEYSIGAPAERVFAAWLDPATIARWLSPTAHASAEVEAVVGGSFRIVMLDPEGRLSAPGTAIEHVGHYLEIDPPRRLAFTWASPYTGPEPSRVTVELEAVGSGTRLTLRHDRLPAEAVDSHRGGWGSMLDNLARLLEEA
jgi:uncharacterized protein YndB with AHSA1/START domain